MKVEKAGWSVGPYEISGVEEMIKLYNWMCKEIQAGEFTLENHANFTGLEFLLTSM